MKGPPHNLDINICVDISGLLMDSSREIQGEMYNSSQKMEFAEFISPKALQKRSMGKSRFLLAGLSRKEKLAGVLEYQLDGCLSLLFVHPEYRNRGIAKMLVKTYLKGMKQTPYVFASPQSLVFYLKMGFRFSSSAITKGNFCVYPMIFTNLDK